MARRRTPTVASCRCLGETQYLEEQEAHLKVCTYVSNNKIKENERGTVRRVYERVSKCASLLRGFPIKARTMKDHNRPNVYISNVLKSVAHFLGVRYFTFSSSSLKLALSNHCLLAGSKPRLKNKNKKKTNKY